jgi:glycosyltransferase involved in cell wall biosynthesis
MFKLILLNYEYPPVGGGASPATRELAVALTEYHDVSVDVVTMSYKNLPKRENDKGVTVHRVPCLRSKKEISSTIEMGSYIPSALAKGRQLISQNNYDLVHSNFIVPTGIVGHILSSIAGVPHLITSHGSDVPSYNPDNYQLIHRVIKPVSKHIANAAERITAPSDFQIKLILEQYSTDPDQTVTIPYGFNPETIIPASEKDDHIFIASRLLKRKGIQYVLKALEEIDTDYQIRIAGEGPYKESLIKQASSMQHNITFLGWLEGQDLLNEYSRSKIFALPSTAESFDVVFMEAMAGRNAVIAADSSGCADVVGDAGILVSPRDVEQIRQAILTLLNNPEYRRELQKQARKRIETDLSWESVADQVVELYESVSNSRL